MYLAHQQCWLVVITSASSFNLSVPKSDVIATERQTVDIFSHILPEDGWLTLDTGKSISSKTVRRRTERFIAQAQSHALKASKANTPTSAIDEHDLAAGQFATAAKGIDDTSEV